MPFNSYEFIFAFLPVTVAGYLLMVRFSGRAAVLGWLILASIVFYARCSLTSLVVITPSILLDYFIARILLSNSVNVRMRTLVFVLGIAANILFLGYFKYKSFFLATANSVLAMHFEVARTMLPLGISFLIFQKIAFLTDVRSGQVRSVNFWDFLLFTLFFPRTIAGPIVRYQEIAPQLAEVTEKGVITNMIVGGSLFSIGLFKKAVIADSLAEFVLRTFDRTEWFLGQPVDLLTAWTGVFTYTFQLYFDFSGYSDMALGVARIFGVRLPANFNSPFKARSIVEYWGRWHITLTRFLTSYVYTPIVLHLTRARLAKGRSTLRGKRSSLPAIAALVVVPSLATMFISGLWHGAGWQFIVWGLLHGVYIAINQTWRMLRPRFWSDEAHYERVMKPIGFVLTLGCVIAALVFFRADSVSSALSILGGMIGMNGMLPYGVQLLQRLGVDTPWNLVSLYVPITPFVWVIASFLTVTLLPNSLEILRRFQPALDFPAEAPRHPAQSPASVREPAETGGASATARLIAAWSDAVRVGSEGVSLSRIAAAIIALVFVLGILAVNRGGAFLYGQF